MDELSQLVREIRETCEHVSSQLNENRGETHGSRTQQYSWKPPTGPNRSDGRSNDSVTGSNGSFVRVGESEIGQATLDGLERKIDSVRADLALLLNRVPCNLKDVMEQAKDSILVRIGSILHSNRSNGSVVHDAGLDKDANGSNRSQLSAAQQLEQLTPRERSVFRLCFDSGHLTYGELGEKLGLSRLRAKNVVNAILRHPHKSGLLTKADKGKEVRVGVPDEISDELLNAKSTKIGPKPTA